MNLYFARDGEPLTLEEWSALFEAAKESAATAADYRHVGRDMYVLDALGREHGVSTVWLGLDHSLGPPSRPLIFETMIFCHNHSCALDESRWRYSTEAEAEAGHIAACTFVRSAAEREP